MPEGNLAPPTRHPIAWKSPDYYDEAAAFGELERIFDICHGCRRCVSLCAAFPTLFDLVDEGATGEVDAVAKKDYWKVVDQCYLCDLCYMTKCPYVPPHPWNVDFPHTMLRAKAIKFKQGGVDFGARLLASTDVHGQLAGIPVVVQAANAVNQTKPMRALMESTLHVDRNAWLPALATRRFRSAAPKSADLPVRDGERTPGKVAVFATCYVNYNEPGIGLDLLKILAHNAIPYVLVEKEQCCGMPKLELGDLEAVDHARRANIPVLAKYAREGWAIVAAVPSCTLMFKQEIPLMFADDADVQAVKAAMWDPFEYLAARRRDGLLKTEFTQPLGQVSYHVPCHTRVQNFGRKTEELLKLVPGTTVHTTERCSGHAGTYGVKKATHETAMKIGKPLFKRMAEPPQGGAPDYISSDCPLGGHHIDQGFDRNGLGTPRLEHPLTLIRMAYGLEWTMQLTGRITPDSLMTLEAYAKWRKVHQAEVIAHRKLRSVALGEHILVQFESELTMRYQIQEMLRIEKIFEEEGIQQEVEAYAPLVPDGGNWKATMLLEYPDVNERRRELARLIGVQDRMFVEVEGQGRVYAIADEDLPRDNDEKTSAVHFLRFELGAPMRAAVKAGAAVKLGCDHTNYPAHVAIGAETLASLAGDLR